MPYMRYFAEGLTSEMKKKAEVELGETEEVRKQSLKEMKELIIDEPDFYPCEDDTFLLRFLRYKKFDVEGAFSAMKSYYRYKARYSGVITDLLPSEREDILNEGYGMLLEFRDSEGVGVTYYRFGLLDTQYSTEQILSTAVLLSEVGLTFETTQVAGYSVILDFAGFNLRHAKHFAGTSAMYKLMTTILHGIPARIKAYHVVNQPAHVNIILNIARTFLSDKLKKRLHLHGTNMKSLHKFISPDILPEELGGKQGPASKYNETYKKLVLSKEEHFKRLKEFGYKRIN